MIERTPYMDFLDVRLVDGGPPLTVEIGPSTRFIGNPVLGAYHGGVIAGLIECTTSSAIQPRFGQPIRLVSLTTSYLGRTDATLVLTAVAEVTKSRGKVLAAHCRVYQGGDRLVAKATAIYQAVRDG